MKVWVLPAQEDWICDQLAAEWHEYAHDISCPLISPHCADILWLLSDWRWRSIDPRLLAEKKVVTTVHHIVPEKFDRVAQMDFAARDAVTSMYHVYNQRAYDFVRPLTKKEVRLVPYWANQHRWHRTADKGELRVKHSLPVDGHLVGSFQRDTEGHDLKSPKLEKGPDLLADYLIEAAKDVGDRFHVVLAGWRRQYVMGRLDAAGVKYTYFERPPQATLNELYQTLDLYPVTARHEGGPQALLECGLLDVPVVSRPVGIAEQVLPPSAIHDDVSQATPAVPNVDSMKLPLGIVPYRQMFADVLSS